MKYNVHIFTVVRVKVSDIEASSHVDAMAKAEELIPFHKIFDRDDNPEMEWGEEHSHALVDEVGDEEYENSKWYGPDLDSPIGPAPSDDQERLAINHKETVYLPNHRPPKL